MSKVVVDISPSVDGFVASLGVTVERPFGVAGHRLHHWLGFEGAEPTQADHDAAGRMFANAGAVVIGHRMFEVGIGLWGDDGAFCRPTFVVTSKERDDLVRGPTTFRFVTGGVDKAVELARAAAGGKDVVVAGGANVVQQCLAAGLVDELRLHVVPVLLGAGTRLFSHAPSDGAELEPLGAVTTPLAAHLTYRVLRKP